MILLINQHAIRARSLMFFVEYHSQKGLALHAFSMMSVLLWVENWMYEFLEPLSLVRQISGGQRNRYTGDDCL
jgi:hypothetical protein